MKYETGAAINCISKLDSTELSKPLSDCYTTIVNTDSRKYRVPWIRGTLYQYTKFYYDVTAIHMNYLKIILNLV